MKRIRTPRRTTTRLTSTVGALVTVAMALSVEARHAGAQAGRSEAKSDASVALSSATDSVGAARGAFRAAVTALRSGDTSAARRELARAAAAWPTQGSYWLASARLAGAAGDANAAAAALDRLADLGLGHDARNDRAFDRVRDSSAWREAADRAWRNVTPIAGAAPAFSLADPDFFPEGVAGDPRDASWYLSSVRSGRVMRVGAKGAPRELTAPGVAASLGAVLGVAIDTARNALWLATAEIPQRSGGSVHLTHGGELVALSLADGQVLGRWVAADSSPEHSFGDVTVAANGDVFVSDTRTPAVLRLRSQGGRAVPAMAQLEVVAGGGLIANPQGIVALDDDEALLVADYLHGLVRLSLADGRAERIAEPAGVSVLGIDGLCGDARAGRVVYGVQNGVAPPRLVRLTFEAHFTRLARLEVIDRQPALAPEPTQCAVAADGVRYVANSQWEQRDEQGEPKRGAKLTGALVLRVPREGSREGSRER